MATLTDVVQRLLTRLLLARLLLLLIHYGDCSSSVVAGLFAVPDCGRPEGGWVNAPEQEGGRVARTTSQDRTLKLRGALRMRESR